MSYENALKTIEIATNREFSHSSNLGAACDKLLEAFASSFGAPPERVAITDVEQPSKTACNFNVAVDFFVGSTLKHTTKVPVSLELTRHGLSGSVASGNVHHLGDIAKANWSFVLHELANAVMKDCQDREELSAL